MVWGQQLTEGHPPFDSQGLMGGPMEAHEDPRRRIGCTQGRCLTQHHKVARPGGGAWVTTVGGLDPGMVRAPLHPEAHPTGSKLGTQVGGTMDLTVALLVLLGLEMMRIVLVGGRLHLMGGVQEAGLTSTEGQQAPLGKIFTPLTLAAAIRLSPSGPITEANLRMVIGGGMMPPPRVEGDMTARPNGAQGAMMAIRTNEAREGMMPHPPIESGGGTGGLRLGATGACPMTGWAPKLAGLATQE